MFEKFKKHALSSEQMKKVKGGEEYYYSCTCTSGGANFGCPASTTGDVVDCIHVFCPSGSGANCTIQ